LPPRTAAALVIGNELLTGKIADANTPVLAKALFSIGVRLERVVMVLDDVEVIASEVRALSAAYDVLFTSGGIGPTHDDVTINSIAQAFGVEVERADGIEQMLRGYYGDKITAGHLHMARAPAGARLVITDEMPWPTIVMRNVWILPGVPEIFALKMSVVHAELGGGQAIVSVAVYTHMDEGNLKPLLDDVVAAHPDIDVGSYPKWKDPRYRTKVTFDGASQAAVTAARDAFVSTLPDGAIADLDA
jgi:molybdenum cofactor synthesis domain-containing protein